MGLETRTLEKLPTSAEVEAKVSEAQPADSDGSVSWYVCAQ
jgi:hypothetical protein